MEPFGVVAGGQQERDGGVGSDSVAVQQARGVGLHAGGRCSAATRRAHIGMSRVVVAPMALAARAAPVANREPCDGP